jgi:metal-responsive CopG/Arc/MetJ family transcriptional regulator
MATKKVTITLPEDMVEYGHAMASEEGMSFSAWIAEVTRHEIRRQRGLAAMREWEELDGPITEEERAQARDEMHRAEAALAKKKTDAQRARRENAA